MRFTGTTVSRSPNGRITEEIGLDDGVTALTHSVSFGVHDSPNGRLPPAACRSATVESRHDARGPIVVIVWLAAWSVSGQASVLGDWPVTGRDAGGTGSSPLTGITP